MNWLWPLSITELKCKTCGFSCKHNQNYIHQMPSLCKLELLDITIMWLSGLMGKRLNQIWYSFAVSGQNVLPEEVLYTECMHSNNMGFAAMFPILSCSCTCTNKKGSPYKNLSSLSLVVLQLMKSTDEMRSCTCTDQQNCKSSTYKNLSYLCH